MSMFVTVGGQQIEVPREVASGPAAGKKLDEWLKKEGYCTCPKRPCPTHGEEIKKKPAEAEAPAPKKEGQ